MSPRRPPPPLAEDPVGYVAAVARDLSGPPLGYAFIMLVCVVWVGGSFLVESLEAAGLSPLLLTYVCNALFVVLLPVYYARRHMLGGTTPEMTDGRGDAARRVGRPSRTSRSSRSSVRDASARGNDASSGEDEADDYGTALLDVHEAPGGNVGEFPPGDAEGSNPREGFNAAEGDDVSSSASRVGAPSRLRPNSVRDGDRRNSVTFAGYTEAERFEHTARAAVGIAPLWFAAQLAFNYSLLYTSVTSNSILSTSSAVFTFFFERVLGERAVQQRKSGGDFRVRPRERFGDAGGLGEVLRGRKRKHLR